MTTLTKTGTVIAATALAAALSGGIAAISAHAEDAKIHCMGVNACKGQSACKTATSACKGQNACKGQGYLEMTEAQCKEAGGKVEGQ